MVLLKSHCEFWPLLVSRFKCCQEIARWEIMIESHLNRAEGPFSIDATVRRNALNSGAFKAAPSTYYPTSSYSLARHLSF